MRKRFFKSLIIFLRELWFFDLTRICPVFSLFVGPVSFSLMNCLAKNLSSVSGSREPENGVHQGPVQIWARMDTCAVASSPAPISILLSQERTLRASNASQRLFHNPTWAAPEVKTEPEFRQRVVDHFAGDR